MTAGEDNHVMGEGDHVMVLGSHEDNCVFENHNFTMGEISLPPNHFVFHSEISEDRMESYNDDSIPYYSNGTNSTTNRSWQDPCGDRRGLTGPHHGSTEPFAGDSKGPVKNIQNKICESEILVFINLRLAIKQRLLSYFSHCDRSLINIVLILLYSWLGSMLNVYSRFTIQCPSYSRTISIKVIRVHVQHCTICGTFRKLVRQSADLFICDFLSAWSLRTKSLFLKALLPSHKDIGCQILTHRQLTGLPKIRRHLCGSSYQFCDNVNNIYHIVVYLHPRHSEAYNISGILGTFSERIPNQKIRTIVLDHTLNLTDDRLHRDVKCCQYFCELNVEENYQLFLCQMDCNTCDSSVFSLIMRLGAKTNARTVYANMSDILQSYEMQVFLIRPFLSFVKSLNQLAQFPGTLEMCKPTERSYMNSNFSEFYKVLFLTPRKTMMTNGGYSNVPIIKMYLSKSTTVPCLRFTVNLYIHVLVQILNIKMFTLFFTNAYYGRTISRRERRLILQNHSTNHETASCKRVNNDNVINPKTDAIALSHNSLAPQTNGASGTLVSSVEVFKLSQFVFLLDGDYYTTYNCCRYEIIQGAILAPELECQFVPEIQTTNPKNGNQKLIPHRARTPSGENCATTDESKAVNAEMSERTRRDNSTSPRDETRNQATSSQLGSLSSEMSLLFSFYNQCVDITFNGRPEFSGPFPSTIKHRRKGKTRERVIWPKYSVETEETELEIKSKGTSGERMRRRRTLKDHNKHGGTILSLRFPFFLVLLCFLIGGGEASCPRLCSCKWKGGKQTVECINKGLTTIPSDIDPGTQVLDMTGNPLVIISREKFKIIGLTNLQRIYATRCKLVQLDDSAFRGLSNLVELDLSINELRVVPAATLQFLPSLMRLQLSFNPITHIKDGSFRALAYLTSLELTGCAIHTLESLAFQGLDRLEWLKINDNNLTTVPPKMMLPKSLHGVDMHNNPWTCDCKLRQLRQWLVQYNVPSSIEPKCAGPKRLRNRVIKEVIPSDLACAPDMRPTSLFLDIIEGKNVSFECHVTAVPDAEVQWLFNGYPLENSTFAYEDATSLYVYEDKELDENKVSYLRIETVTEAHSGIFQCIAENQAGRTISNFTLRVSLPPTKPAPSVPPMDHIVYIGTALISLVALVIILFCILIIRCCKRRSKHVKNKSNPSIMTREKQNNSDRPKSNNMPKYIQMGTPAPKVNGILADTPPISVIENSPYRTEPVATTNINPDIIADGPDDRAKPAKKKVSIIGVEEMDANGVIVTRKLDDIIEESEDNFDPTYEKIQVRNGYDNAQALLSNHYSNLTRQQLDSGTNQYPLTDLPPNQVPQQNVKFYDQQGFAVDYILPREPWQENPRADHVMRYSSPVPSDQSPLYSTIRRKRHEAGLHSNLLHDQKYPEEYNLQEVNPHHFAGPDSRYQQNYGLAPCQKKMCVEGNTFCECCQPTTSNPMPPEYDSLEPMGRMRGDGCSFDHLLTSCGGQCCYDEKTGQLFNNTLPENYRPLEDNPPPPPPEGYGDSEDEVDDTKEKEWGDGTLSPGTRVLYSPPEETFSGTRNEQTQLNVGVTNV